MQKNSIVIMVIAVLVVGAGSFYGGMVYGKSQVPASTGGRNFSFNGQNLPGGSGQNFPGGNGAARTRGAGGNGGGFGGGVSGQILSKNDTGFTIKSVDGGSRIIFLTSSTTISRQSTGTATDLNNGVDVVVIGDANTDGSINARNVQIRPQLPGDTNGRMIPASNQTNQ